MASIAALLSPLVAPLLLAATPGTGTPPAIQPGTLPTNPCPLIVAPADAAMQPLRIPAADVAKKNRAGCLSPSDAIYGSDGCPLRLCSPAAGVIPLPAGPTPTSPQLPAP